MKSGAPHAIRRGSLVAVMPAASDSISAFSAGRWVCSVAFPARRLPSMFCRYSRKGMEHVM